MLNITPESRMRTKNLKLNHLKDKTLNGKKGRLNNKETKFKCLKERDEYLKNNLGGFEWIYPLE